MNPQHNPLFDRRGFLSWVSGGLGGAALASLLQRDDLTASAASGPHHPPKARRAIHICLCGALSQVDSFDYKPALARLHGRSLSTSTVTAPGTGASAAYEPLRRSTTSASTATWGSAGSTRARTSTRC